MLAKPSPEIGDTELTMLTISASPKINKYIRNMKKFGEGYIPFPSLPLLFFEALFRGNYFFNG